MRKSRNETQNSVQTEYVNPTDPPEESALHNATFSDLPEEIILNIFSYFKSADLYNPALVCKQWHRLTQDSSLWTHLSFKGNVPTNTIIKLLLHLKDRIKSLELIERHDGNLLIDTVCKHNTQLEELMIKCCRGEGRRRKAISGKISRKIPSCLPNLRSLVIEQTTIQDGFQDVLGYVLPNMKNLRRVDMKHVEGYRDPEWYPHFLSIHFHKENHCLEEICFTDIPIDSLYLTYLTKYFHDCLTVLKIDALILGDDDMDTLTNFQKLRTFHLFNGYLLTDEGLLKFGKLNLRSLNLSRIIKSTSRGLVEMLKTPGLSKVRELGLSCPAVTDFVLSEIGHNLKHLESIAFPSCHNITLAGFKTLFKDCQNITTLNIVNTCDNERRKDLINYLIYRHIKLKEIVLSHLDTYYPSNNSLLEKLQEINPSMKIRFEKDDSNKLLGLSTIEFFKFNRQRSLQMFPREI